VYEWFEHASGSTTTPVGIDSSIFVTHVLTATRQYWVRVSNSFGTVSTDAATVTVQPNIPVINSSPTFSAAVGKLFAYRINATHTPTAFTASPLPDGLVLNTAIGWITGLPTTAGLSSVALGASNGSYTGTATLALTITPAVPVITSAATAQGRAGELFSYQITGTNGPFNSFAVGLPDGLTVNLTTGEISGTPLITGTFSVQLQASNPGGLGLAPLTLTVAPGTVPPTITSAPFAGGKVSVPFTFQVQATQSPMGYAAAGLPNGLTIHPATGLITGTPTLAGTYSLSVTAGNILGTSLPRPLIITVEPSVLAPALSNAASARGTVGTALIFDLTAAPAATQFSAANLPPGLILNIFTGRISGTPLAPGTWAVTAGAANAGGPSPALVVSFVIGPAPTAPVLPASLIIQGTVGVPLSASQLTAAAPATFTSTQLPAGLQLAAATGLIAGTPLSAGEFSATVTAENATTLSANTLVRFVINAPAGTPEVVSSLSAEGQQGQPFIYEISTTPAATSYAASPLPAGLTRSERTISGSPLVAGDFAITLSASNAAGQGFPEVLLLRIRPIVGVPQLTSSPAASASVGVAFSYQITATNGPITAYAASALPTGLRLDAQTGVLSGTPTEPGIFTIPLTAANVNSASEPLNLLLPIAPAAQTPVVYSARSVTGYVGQELFYRIEATNLPTQRPLPSSAYFGAENLPAGLSLTASTGEIRGAPTTAGAFAAKVWAKNATGDGAKKMVSFGITAYSATIRVLGPGYLVATFG